MSVDHAQRSSGDDPERDLDELLTLAAELAGPEDREAALERRDRYSGERMLGLLAAEEAPPAGGAELLGRNGRPRQRARIRAALAASVGAPPGGVPPAGVDARAVGSRHLPSLPMGRWRLPIAVGTAAATAAAASAIALHTWGPDRSVTTPYTSVPLVAQGDAGASGIWPQPVFVPNNSGSGGSGGSGGGGGPRIVLPAPAVQPPSRSGSSSGSSGSSGAGASVGASSAGSSVAGQQAAQAAPAPAGGSGGSGGGASTGHGDTPTTGGGPSNGGSPAA
ncbi:MAG: hypothetical protein QOG45_3017, partial [Chloroflexota bacterium]|nr:hypothetical protein [Chloroflexota bacterium]